MVTTADIKRGIAIVFKNEPHLVVEFQHVNPGKGSAFVRTRLKGLRSGKVVEHTYKSGEAIEMVDLERKKVQYLYGTPTEYTFMDNTSYEQFSVNPDILGEYAKYLKEGIELQLLTDAGVPVTVDFPKKVTLKVVDSPSAVRGDSSGNITKDAILENGLQVKVPMFIKEGESIVINTDTGDYVERFNP